jgi:hypothetical protein
VAARDRERLIVIGTVKRGFKAAAERKSLAERAALGLTDRCRLDPLRLADAKRIPVIPISTLPGVPAEHLEQLQRRDPGAFSAATVVRDERALVVVNDSHTSERQANSIAHELSHLLLGHEPRPAFSSYQARELDRKSEDEADWLAGCLLVPGSGIQTTMTACGGDLHGAAVHYGVSLELMRWRYSVTRPSSLRSPTSR